MKNPLKSYRLLGAVLLALAAPAAQSQTYLTCGAVSTNLGAQLKFVSTNLATSSGYAQPLVYQRFTNHFTGPGGTFCYSTLINNTPGNFLVQALSAKTNGAVAAAYGSYIACRILSVNGPSGATLYFWESSAGWPTYSFPVGGAYSSNKNWFAVGNIESGAGTPGGDPYGSIANRRFTVDKAGEYSVTFQLFDLSKNHTTDTNSAFHSPSDPFTVKFSTQTDLATTRFVRTNNVVTLAFKQSGLTNMYVETATDINGSWTPVAGPFTNAPVATNITTMAFTNSPTISSIFYRLRGATP